MGSLGRICGARETVSGRGNSRAKHSGTETHVEFSRNRKTSVAGRVRTKGKGLKDEVGQLGKVTCCDFRG